jgi:hypothetical protein
MDLGMGLSAYCRQMLVSNNTTVGASPTNVAIVGNSCHRNVLVSDCGMCVVTIGNRNDVIKHFDC